MADDIVTRLRKWALVSFQYPTSESLPSDLTNAADEIERLRTENARLASSLHPVGMTVRYDGIKDMPPERVEKILKEIRDFRCA
jgi:hypothetical protein